MQAVSVKHIPDYRPLRPGRGRSPSPTFTQFVVLSMLLHALAVFLFGAPTGGSSEGRALWGSLQVAILNLPPEPGPELKLDRTIPTLNVPPSPAAPPAPTPRAEAAPRSDAIEIPPMLDRIITPERELRAPDFKVPLPTEITTAPLPVVPAPLPRVEAAPVPRLEPLPMPVPAPAIPRIAPVAPSTAPALRELPPLPVPSLAAPKLDALPAVPLPTLRAPLEVPAIPLAPVAPIAVPQALERVPASVAPPALQELPAVERAAPRAPERPAQIERETPVRTDPARQPSPFRPPPASGDSVIGSQPPSAADPAGKPLDLDAMRSRAGQITREGAGRKAPLAFPMPPLPEKKTDLEAAIDKARKPDCKTAYKDLGLLAAIPLIANEFGEGNCRW